MKGAMMKQRRALVTGLSMAMMGLAQAAPPKLPAADNGAEKGACPRCGRSFDCGAHDSSKPCWCVSLPALPLEELGRQDASCYCPDCLRTQLAERALPGQEKP